MTENAITLEGKTILVTGASGMVGREIAIRASQLGAKLCVVDMDGERLEETLSAMEGEDHIQRRYDLLEDLDGIPRLVQDICKEAGPLAGVVHSAGIHQIKPIRVLKYSDLRQLFLVNAVAGVMLVKGLSARNNHTSGASAVLISSVMGHVAQPGLTSYCVSKGAVESAVKVMALELVSEKIRVNALAPGNMESAMGLGLVKAVGKEAAQRILAMHPMGYGQPIDIAHAAAFLLSDASRWITGTSLVVDGGYCAQ